MAIPVLSCILCSQVQVLQHSRVPPGELLASLMSPCAFMTSEESFKYCGFVKGVPYVVSFLQEMRGHQGWRRVSPAMLGIPALLLFIAHGHR